MRKTILLLTVLLSLIAVQQADGRRISEKKMGAYLFTFFNDPTHSLFMAISYDGYTFTAVNDGQPDIAGDSIAEQHGIRDPHICRELAIAPRNGNVPTAMAGAITVDWC